MEISLGDKFDDPAHVVVRGRSSAGSIPSLTVVLKKC